MSYKDVLRVKQIDRPNNAPKKKDDDHWIYVYDYAKRDYVPRQVGAA